MPATAVLTGVPARDAVPFFERGSLMTGSSRQQDKNGCIMDRNDTAYSKQRIPTRTVLRYAYSKK